MRIVSLLPSATEILFAMGFDREVVGVSHECDFPPQARNKRVVIQSRIPKDAAPLEIDRLVREYVSRGESLYAVDAQALEELVPDLIVTQDLCHVCAASPDDLGAALAHLRRRPQIVTLNPHSLAGVCANIRTVARATGRVEQGNVVIANFERAVAQVEQAVAGLSRQRVVCLEW